MSAANWGMGARYFFSGGKLGDHAGGNFEVHNFRLARLQSEFWHERFFWGATNFLTKNAPIFSPIFLSLYFAGPKKSRKIPAKFPTKFPSKKSKNIHRRASAGAHPKMRNFMGMGFPAERTHFPGAHKIGEAISAPELRANNCTDTRISLKFIRRDPPIPNMIARAQ